MSPEAAGPAPFKMPAARSVITLAAYGVVILLLVLVEGRVGEDVTILLVGALMVYLARYLSVSYTIAEGRLIAWRIFGWRSVPLDSIHRVELTSLRDLSPVSWVGTWGWRSRMWSPDLGAFDAISTDHRGLMIHGDDVPFFISPRDPEAFGRALVERVEGLDAVVPHRPPS